VLKQRQLGRVAEDLIERERRVAFGGDDDLRAERGVLIGVGLAAEQKRGSSVIGSPVHSPCARASACRLAPRSVGRTIVVVRRLSPKVVAVAVAVTAVVAGAGLAATQLLGSSDASSDLERFVLQASDLSSGYSEYSVSRQQRAARILHSNAARYGGCGRGESSGARL
jgi:hypothetical protein